MFVFGTKHVQLRAETSPAMPLIEAHLEGFIYDPANHHNHGVEYTLQMCNTYEVNLKSC